MTRIRKTRPAAPVAPSAAGMGADSPLKALARLKDKAGEPFLPRAALAAGEQLARDFELAHLQPRLGIVWAPKLGDRPVGAAPASQTVSERAMAARRRVAAACRAMGPELCGVALDACCFEKGLELIERERQWPVRSAKLLLRAALLALARHYQPPSRATIRHWGDEDYRPDL